MKNKIKLEQNAKKNKVNEKSVWKKEAKKNKVNEKSVWKKEAKKNKVNEKSVWKKEAKKNKVNEKSVWKKGKTESPKKNTEKKIKKIFIFNTSKALNKFLGLLKFPFFRIDYGAIETGRLYKYKKTRILITAEHAETGRIPVMGLKTKSGKEPFIPVGDKNTDKLAKLAAQSVNGAYILSRLPRTVVDMSRSPKELKKGITVPVKIYGTKKMMTRLMVHDNLKKERILKRYQRRVDKLHPEIILSYHGMHRRHKTDIALGFGPNKIYIGGIKYAKLFTKLYRKRLAQTLKKLKLKNNLRVRRSKYVFLGRTNYTLKRNVKIYNRKNENKRMGVHVEFNLRGRTRKDSKDVPKLRYQVAAQVLARTAMEFWNKYKNEISESIEQMNLEAVKKKRLKRKQLKKE